MMQGYGSKKGGCIYLLLFHFSNKQAADGFIEPHHHFVSILAGIFRSSQIKKNQKSK
jgi:hypothetical protein